MSFSVDIDLKLASKICFKKSSINQSSNHYWQYANTALFLIKNRPKIKVKKKTRIKVMIKSLQI